MTATDPATCPNCAPGLDCERGVYQPAEPAPEPDSGPGWRRDRVEHIALWLEADCPDPTMPPGFGGELRALLADRDRQAQVAANLFALVERRFVALEKASASLGRLRAELAEVTAAMHRAQQACERLTAERVDLVAELDRLRERVHAAVDAGAELLADEQDEVERMLATARRDAAADMLEPVRAIICDPELTGIVERGVVGTSPDTYSGVTKDEALDAMATALRSARELLTGDRPVPGSPQPAPDGGEEPT